MPVVKRPARLFAASAAVFAAFAILFGSGSALGVWPLPPPGAFVGLDLWAGLASGAVLLVTLLRERGPASP